MISAFIFFFILLGFLLCAFGFWQRNALFVISGGIILLGSGFYYYAYGFEYERPLKTDINQTQTFSYDVQNRTSEILTFRNESVSYEAISYKPTNFNALIAVFLVLVGMVNFAFAYDWVRYKRM